MEPEQAYFRKLAVLFGFIALVSLCAVGGLCWFVAGKGIVPVQESINALGYAPEGSTVTLKLETAGEGCRFLVIDHGPGIDDSEKKRVFDRFYRGSASRSDPDHFGLGLSVALELARVQGGDVTVTDTPGGGASFAISMPFDDHSV